jgi:hypothetical protein
MNLSELLNRALERMLYWLCRALTSDYSFLTKEVGGVSLLDILLFMAFLSFIKWVFKKRKGRPLIRF